MFLPLRHMNKRRANVTERSKRISLKKNGRDLTANISGEGEKKIRSEESELSKERISKRQGFNLPREALKH